MGTVSELFKDYDVGGTLKAIAGGYYQGTDNLARAVQPWRWINSEQNKLRDQAEIPEFAQKPEPGKEIPFAFGQGAAGAFTPGSAAVGAATSAAAQAIAPDSAIGRLLISLGLPLVAGSLWNIGKAYAQSGKGSNVSNAGSVIPLTKGQASGDPELLRAEQELARNPKTAKQVMDFTKNQEENARRVVEGFAARAKDDKTNGEAAVAAFRAYQEGLQQSFKQYKTTFNQSWRAQGKGNESIDMTPLREKLNALALEYSSPSNPYHAFSEQMRELARTYGTKPMKLQDVQDNLEHLGAAIGSKTNSNWFQNATPGSMNGAEKQLFKGFMESLENASKANPNAAASEVKRATAAKELLDFREGFKQRAEFISKVSDDPLSLFLNRGRTDQRVDATPEAVMNKLRSMEPSEREFFFKTAGSKDQSLIEELRQSILKKMVDAGQVTGANADKPTWSMQKFLQAFDEKAGDLAFLVPGGAERQQLLQRVEEMRKALRSTNALEQQSQLASGLADVAAMSTNQPGTRGTFRDLAGWVKGLVQSPEKLYENLFNVSGPQTSAQRLGNAVKANPTGISPEMAVNRAVEGSTVLRNPQVNAVVSQPVSEPPEPSTQAVEPSIEPTQPAQPKALPDLPAEVLQSAPKTLPDLPTELFSGKQ